MQQEIIRDWMTRYVITPQNFIAWGQSIDANAGNSPITGHGPRSCRWHRHSRQCTRCETRCGMFLSSREMNGPRL